MKTIKEMLEMIVDETLREKLLKLYLDTEERMKVTPSSTKYHHAYPGGYLHHTQQVMNHGIEIFNFMNKVVQLDFPLDDVIYITYIHDLDKLERYVEDGEVKSGENKGKVKFASKLDWTIDPYAKVCLMISKYGLDLTDEQLHAITFQSGGWSEFAKWGDLSKLATLLHCADMLSAKCSPVEEDLKVEEMI